MAYNDNDTAALLVAIRDEGRLPEDDPDATDAKLLKIADRVLARTFVPAIRQARSEYYVRHSDYTIVADRDEYPIPARAAGLTVRAVVWLDTAGVEFELTPEPFGDRFLYSPATGNPCHYTIEDDQVILLPPPNGALGTLRIYYEMLPGKLVMPFDAESDPLVIWPAASYDIATNRLIVVSKDDTPTVVDVINTEAPFNVLAASADVLSSGTAGFFAYLTMDPTQMPSRFLAGGYTTPMMVCTVGETPYPQIPVELHPVLAQFVAAQYLYPIDPEGGATLKADAQSALDNQIALLTPRQIGRQQKIRSRSSMMRRGGRRGGYRGPLE